MPEPVVPNDQVPQGGAPQGEPAGGGQSGGQPAGEGKGELTPQTYKLPDGRELSADKVVEEYNNLLKDYTQKSQKLSTYEKNLESENVPPGVNDGREDPWADPSYVPKDWNELFSEVERRLSAKSEAERQAQIKLEEERKQINTQIDTAVGKIKETDKELDENDMFAYAAEQSKKGVQYTTVEGLYEHYKAIREARKQGQQDAMKNIQRRGFNNPAPGSGSPPGPKPVDMGALRRHSSIVDAVAERLRNQG